MKTLVALVFACGCFNPAYNNPTCGPGGECPSGLVCNSAQQCVQSIAQSDGGPDSADAYVHTFEDAPPPGVVCFGSGFGKTCFAEANVPSTAVNLTTSTVINTDTSASCAANVETDPPWCVVAATDLTIGSGVTLTATGSKPLVLVATGTLTVNGTIDVASHRGGQQGANSNSVGCDLGTLPFNSGGGGAGGSFGARGGDGGQGTNPGGVAGTFATAVTAIRGGCPGQDGKGGTFGVAGPGGGAVYMIAGTKIVVTGVVNASGAAGSGGVMNGGGGGGGGSGGLIGLDSPSIQNSGVIFANGGGGAEGSGLSNRGNDGTESTNGMAAPASGGNSGTGGDGGGGGAANTNAAVGQSGSMSGGGGGGSVGVIKLFQATTITGGVVSPLAS